MCWLWSRAVPPAAERSELRRGSSLLSEWRKQRDAGALQGQERPRGRWRRTRPRGGLSGARSVRVGPVRAPESITVQTCLRTGFEVMRSGPSAFPTDR